MSPLPHERLLDAGADFPVAELRPRILSIFWRDWDYHHPYTSQHTPAPVMEWADTHFGNPQPLRAWWLLKRGILAEPGDPAAEPMRAHFDEDDPARCAEVRYEFRFLAMSSTVEMHFHRGAANGRGHRIRLAVQLGDRMRVIGREAMAGRIVATPI